MLQVLIIAYQLEYGKKKYAPNSAVSYNAMVNVPLNDNLAVRATYSKSLDPGIYQNVMTMDMGVGDQDDERYVVTLENTKTILQGFMMERSLPWCDILLTIDMMKV